MFDTQGEKGWKKRWSVCCFAFSDLSTSGNSERMKSTVNVFKISFATKILLNLNFSLF